MTPYQLAHRYIGVKERKGDLHHPLIQWWLSLCHYDLDVADEIPWCSAFVNGIAWEFDLPRTSSAAARSWLRLPTAVQLADAIVGFDVVILERAGSPTAGHVGLYGGHSLQTVMLLGGNQGDAVTVQAFDRARVLGVRRLA